ncbi:TPA: hypothetical protein ACL1QS_005777 [Pseudomonas aeruginosa]
MKYSSPLPLLGAAVALLLALLALANGNWPSAGLFFIAGILLAIRGVLRVPLFHQTPVLELGAGLLTVVSIIAVLAGGRAFHPENAAAHAELLERFSEAGTQQNSCPSQHRDISAILQVGIKSCGLQDTTDMMSFVSELKKAQSFGPTLSVIDGLISSSSSGRTDACYESYIRTTELCPEALGSISKRAADAIYSYKESQL